MTQQSLFETLDRTPVTWLVLLAYLTMAFLTDPLDPTTQQLVEHGAAVGLLVMDGEPWRLLTYAFLHGGLLHLGFNSYFLVAFGPMVEQQLGSLKFAVLYVVGALGGALGGTLWNDPMMPLVGGSGALFAMMGALVGLNMRHGRHLFEFWGFAGPRTLITLIVANLVIGLVIPMISNSAHIGGLIAGFALAFCFFAQRRQPIDALGRATQAGWIAALLGLTFWCAFPVTRWDWQLRQMYRSDSIEEASSRRAALERQVTFPIGIDRLYMDRVEGWKND